MARKDNQHMIGFDTAVKRFWQKYAIFDGVAQRSEYWFAVLFIFLGSVVCTVFGDLFAMKTLFSGVWSVVTLVPGQSMLSRRLHDAGFSAKWLLALWGDIVLFWMFTALSRISPLFGMLMSVTSFIAVVLCVFMFVASVLPSKFKNNPYRR